MAAERAEDPVLNEVHLAGRVGSEPEEREFGVVVPRGAARRSPRGPTVDAIDVSCWTAATRRSALRLRPNDQAVVDGSLRRRFFRTGGGVQSRYEVEAVKVRRRAT
jgi:single-strand DNA-binding protein